MKMFCLILIFTMGIFLCCSGALLAQDEGEDIDLFNDSTDVQQKDLSGEQEVTGVLSENEEKLVLITLDFGDIVINVSKDKKEELLKYVEAEIIVKGLVTKNNDVYEIKLESFKEAPVEFEDEDYEEKLDDSDPPKTKENETPDSNSDTSQDEDW